MSATVPEGLMWGIKKSFLGYLNRMPDARMSVTGGASVDVRQRFLFPPDSVDDFSAESGEGTIRFGGDVRFSGHHGMMFVMLTAPAVTFTPGGATLSIADPESYPVLDRRLDLLDLQPAGWTDHHGARLFAPMPSALRAEGVALFNDVYPAGEPFDTLSIRVAV
ncbi:hypothetical protein FXB39_04030 [Nocardioides sp. BGMRC 2183]|nr:hypothetical protein FXB39_04030 [Nocardioides sp. BGMRC 2183]